MNLQPSHSQSASMPEIASFDDQALDSKRSWRSLFPDPHAVWAVFRRHMGLFFGVFMLVVAGVALWTVTRTPIYVASSSLLVRPQADAVVDVQSVTPDLPATTDVVNTEVKLMQSPALAWRVAAQFATDHPDDPIVKGAAREEVVSRIAGMTTIARAASTYVIEVFVRAQDPQTAAEIANLYVTQFVSSDKEAKVRMNSSADRWLRERSTELERDATSADAAVQDYRIRNGLISNEGTTLSEQEISTLNQQIAAAQAELAEKQGRLSSARAQLASGGGGADVGAALGSGTIGTLRAREAEASASVAELQSRYGPQYPELLKARSELGAIRQDIQSEIDRILSNLDAEVRVASSRLTSLQGSRSQSTGVLAANNRALVGLQELQRRADAAKAIYETFLNRSRETSAQEGLQRADTQVDSLATAPDEPAYPDRPLAAMLAALGGVICGICAIGTAEYLQSSIRTRADVERRLHLRYAGAIPSLKSTLQGGKTDLAPQDFIVEHPHSAFAECFRSLRTFMLLGGRSRGTSQTMVIASALPQEGKTTTAVCLARASALGGVSTILVDCDLRRRGSSELLGYAQANGLYDYFAGTPLGQLVMIDPPTGLAVLGTAKPPEDPHEILTGENVARLISELRRRYEIIIFDTAPLLGIAETRVLAAAADQTLLISRWSSTSLNAVDTAVDLLVSAGANICGCALSQVNINKYASTGYFDSYSYHKQFRGYYTE